jgi:MarR family transcriptional regulator, organic hydroperoxide resistance regulator
MIDSEPHRVKDTSMSRHDSEALQEAGEILAHVRGLWRDLLRNPFAEAEEHGITGPQVNLMACLVSRGPMTLTDLSEALEMSHSTASGIVDRLQSRGLLRRTRDASDRRRTSISVTDKVTRYVRELEGGPAGLLAAVLAGASPDERRSVIKGLRTLRDLLERRRSPRLPARARPAAGDHRAKR